eukprot:1444754-Amphidinium_carterae.1
MLRAPSFFLAPLTSKRFQFNVPSCVSHQVKEKPIGERDGQQRDVQSQNSGIYIHVKQSLLTLDDTSIWGHKLKVAQCGEAIRGASQHINVEDMCQEIGQNASSSYMS